MSPSADRTTAEADEGVAAPVPLFDAVATESVSGARESNHNGDNDDDLRSTAALKKAARRRRRVERQEIRRFTAASRRRRIGWLIGIASVAGLALIAVLLAYTPLLSVRQIVVEGSYRVSSDAVIADLESQIGTPFPLIDEGEIKAALVGFPLIQSYSVESRPPDTLVVRIVERTPVGVIDTGEGFNVVDAAGVVIEASETRPESYPLITVDSDAAGDGFESAAAVIRALPETLSTRVDTVRAGSADDVALTLRDTGQQIVWGSAEESTLKTAVLEALLVQYPNAPYFDVSSPDVPVVRAE
ncbi:hypothetical protein GCM10027416_21800 [Okibacterium endophyticum]